MKSPFQHYKVGNTFFRSLAEARLQWRALQNRLTYTHPAPRHYIAINELINNPRCNMLYQSQINIPPLTLPPSSIEPENARTRLESTASITYPNSFVASLRNGAVYGEGTTLIDEHTFLSDTTTDFHRIQDHHHILHAGRIASPETFDGTLAVLAAPGSQNYFHWTLDLVTRFQLLQTIDTTIDAYYLPDHAPFQKEWLTLLNIPPAHCLTAHPHRHIQANSLIIPSYAGLPGVPHLSAHSFIQSFIPPTDAATPERIYISRANARRRRIRNEAALIPILKENNFHIIHPETLSVRQQMILFNHAKIIIAPHGAELTNLIFARPDTQVLELFSPYYLNPCFKHLAALGQMHHSALVGKGGKFVLEKGTDTHYVWKNITIDVNTFTSKLHQLLKRR
tara:strand:+ start:1204 stop:2388 length:1185 start_codon:yes stop_codon:yes gene_type:complete